MPKAPMNPRGVCPAASLSMDTDSKLWSDLLGYMRQTQPDICRLWFEELELLGVRAGVLYVRAHSTVHREYLHRACARPFNECAQMATGRLISVRFVGPEEDMPPEADGGGRATFGPSAGGSRTAGVPVGGGLAAQGPAGSFPGAHGGTANPAAGLAPVVTHGRQPLPTGNGTGNGTGHGAAGHGAARLSVGNGAAHAGHASPGHDTHDALLAGATSNGIADADRDPATSMAFNEPLPQRLPSGVSALGDIGTLYNDGLVINPDNSFENFIIGPGNRLAHAAALAVASNPGRAYNPYFVHGDVGLGKTHLLQAICVAIRNSRPDLQIYYTSCEGFMTQFVDALQSGVMTRFRHKFRHVDVLVIDDIQFLTKKDRTQEEFFHTFNALYQSHKQIILSCDAPPEEIPDLEERLISRFKAGLVMSLSPPCFETRVQILQQKARLRGMSLPMDVAQYMAGKIDTNVRELEGAIVKLQAMARLDKAALDLVLARQAIGDQETRIEPRIQIQTIINAVTDFFGVKIQELQSKRRQRSIAQPRQVCMYLARRHTRFSLEEIGGHFGGRDHTTVMHAVRTIQERCDSDPEFAGAIRSLEDQLRAPSAG